ncbi:hypothetical protein BMF94_5209 [Rhodotorula taiwanensis]|uniref:Uncharacterized protein n=1 Tax=Rhodotorula taiwanensis TaxID=741276 RepID=A0A2S5B4Z7_9BASI|nr:hypothetical protein BMF94_5209 [Rhodotorula taiwanensis]
MDIPVATLSILHITVGASALVAPSFTAAFFGLVPEPGSILVTRLFGSRDLALGLALYRAFRSTSSRPRPPVASPGVRVPRILSEAQKGALWIANLVNGIDVLSSLVCYFEGNIGVAGLLWGGPGAAFLLGLGLLGLRD